MGGQGWIKVKWDHVVEKLMGPVDWLVFESRDRTEGRPASEEGLTASGFS
jgi:hypothetical protein